MKGFSLIEMLLTMTIAIILLIVAMPSYQYLLARHHTMVAVNHLVRAIHLARMEAVAKSRVITFCGSQDGKHCDGQWSSQQLIVEDQSQKLVRLYHAIPSGDRLIWQSSLSNDNYLKLAPTGFTCGQRGSFYFCPKSNLEKFAARLIVNYSGRVRVEQGTAIPAEARIAACFGPAH